MRKMDMKKLFQGFQNCGVCRQWKREVPGRADVPCSLNYYSAARQKQSFHRLRAHSLHAACNGLVSTRKTSSRAGGTRLCQLLVEDIWDESRLWCSLLVLHRGRTSFRDPDHPACSLPAAPLHFNMDLAGQTLFS